MKLKLKKMIYFSFCAFWLLILSHQLQAQEDSDYAGLDITICAGTPAQIGAPPLNNTCTYVWTPSIGLSATNVSSPLASPTVTTTYTVTIYNEENEIGTDQVTVNVVTIDLDIYQPSVIANNTTTQVPDADEETIGAMTFENFDNDDLDGRYDYRDGNVVGNDDELVKITLRTSPVLPETKVVRLNALQGGGDIKIFKTATRGNRYNLGNDIQLTQNGNEYVAEFWVEGTNRQAVQQGTILELSLKDQTIPCNNDKVALTIVGVENITWNGVNNGFAPPLHDSNELDTDDPNFNTNINGLLSNRVFSGARAPDYQIAKNRVKLVIELSVAPTMPISLFAKAFDVDDPFREVEVANTGLFVDPNDAGVAGIYSGTQIVYTIDEDNRGDVMGNKAGFLANQEPDGTAQYSLQLATLLVQLSLQ